MLRFPSFGRAALVAVALLSFTSAAPLQAWSIWKGGGNDGDWFNAGNWEGGVPTEDRGAAFYVDGKITISGKKNVAESNEVFLLNGMGGTLVEIEVSEAIWNIGAGGLMVGGYEVGTLVELGSEGRMVISGKGSVFVAGPVTVGDEYYRGLLTLDDGTLTSSVGTNVHMGAVLLQNGSSWTATGKMDFSDSSTLTITSGSVLESSGGTMQLYGATQLAGTGSELRLIGDQYLISSDSFTVSDGASFSVGGALLPRGCWQR